MKKIISCILLGICAYANTNLALANKASQCDMTWNQSSAALTCGYVCTNPENTYHYSFSSSYDPEEDECTFNAGCCQGLPYQICTHSYAVCDPTSITVKKGDSNFQNRNGTLIKN